MVVVNCKWWNGLWWNGTNNNNGSFRMGVVIKEQAKATEERVVAKG